jgi:predicted acyltransferase
MNLENASLRPHDTTVRPLQSPKPPRLLSLDVFRGLTIACMLLVNNHGSSSHFYPGLHHVTWEGWSLADVVFPSFIFIVGVAIPFSLESRRARGLSRGTILLNVVWRSILLFALGLFLNAFPAGIGRRMEHFDLAHLRIMGVLQRIAICYLFASVIYLYLRPKAQVVLGVSILILYFILLKFVPVPGQGAGELAKPDGTWAQYVDTRLLAGHLQYLPQPGQSDLYHAGFEQKGVLSTLPAIVTALIGAWVGRHLKSAATPLEKTAQLYLWGTLAILMGLVWSASFPIVQHLWTSSMVLFMAGIGMLALASCYYLVDIKRIKWWTAPLVVLGTNAIAVWTLDWFLRAALFQVVLTGSDGKIVNLKTYLWQGLSLWTGPYAGSLMMALAEVLFWIGVMSLLYRKRIFIRI